MMPDTIRLSRTKSQTEIASEWNVVSETRNKEIASGMDISYHHVLMPAITSLIPHWAGKRVLDIGCGSGHLAHALALRQSHVTGIDISDVAIEIAKSEENTVDTCFLSVSVEEYAKCFSGLGFDVVVANMVLQSVPDLLPFLVSARALTLSDFLVTIPHPIFWPRYWGFETAVWYDYTKETPIEAPFRTTGNPAGAGCITYIHRPLAKYVSSLIDSGFRLVDFRELMPTPDVMQLYPQAWAYPRFIAMRFNSA